MRHRHKWEDTRLEYFPPLERVEVEFAPRDLIERFVSGWTIIHQRCIECGTPRSVTVVGDARPR